MTDRAGELLSVGPDEDCPRRRGARWPMVLAVLALLALAAVGAGRALIARRDHAALSRLAAVWAERGATHEALAAATAAVGAAAGPGDGLLANRAVNALQREDAAHLQALQRRAAGTPAFGTTRRLRSDIEASLATEERALSAAAEAGSEVDAFRLVASAPAQRVQAEFLALTHQSPTAAHPVTVRLHAADAARRRLARLLDTPLPLRVLVNGADGASVMDLATSRVTPVPAVPDVRRAVLRGNYLVSLQAPYVLAVRLPNGPSSLLANGATALAAAPAPDSVWVGAAVPPGATLVDVAGRVLRRVRLPAPLRGAVASGLVIGSGPPIVWDPVRGRIARRLPACRRFLAAGGDLVVLAGCPGRPGTVHVVDARTGRDTAVPLPVDTVVRAASLAPDGGHLALAAQPVGSVERLLLADLRTGRVTEVRAPGSLSVADEVIWTDDATRLFFTAGGLSDAPAASLWTYAIGDRVATALRYLRPGLVRPVAVLPAG